MQPPREGCIINDDDDDDGDVYADNECKQLGMRERRDECKREPWMCVGYRVDGRRVE